MKIRNRGSVRDFIFLTTYLKLRVKGRKTGCLKEGERIEWRKERVREGGRDGGRGGGRGKVRDKERRTKELQHIFYSWRVLFDTCIMLVKKKSMMSCPRKEIKYRVVMSMTVYCFWNFKITKKDKRNFSAYLDAIMTSIELFRLGVPKS